MDRQRQHIALFKTLEGAFQTASDTPHVDQRGLASNVRCPCGHWKDRHSVQLLGTIEMTNNIQPSACLANTVFILMYFYKWSKA